MSKRVEYAGRRRMGATKFSISDGFRPSLGYFAPHFAMNPVDPECMPPDGVHERSPLRWNFQFDSNSGWHSISSKKISRKPADVNAHQCTENFIHFLCHCTIRTINAVSIWGKILIMARFLKCCRAVLTQIIQTPCRNSQNEVQTSTAAFSLIFFRALARR